MLTYKFRLYPSKSQVTTLEATLEECRMLHNNFLAERKFSWKDHKKSISRYDQIKRLPRLKREYPKLKTVYSQVLQNVATRVDLAYQAFFRRLKSKEKPGYPRFKGYGRYDSFCFPDATSLKISEDSVHIPKIGKVSWVMHRQIEGKVKTATIKRSGEDWFVFVVANATRKIQVSENNNLVGIDDSNSVGIDVGITTFATLSDGNTIENPRFFETKQNDLARKQRKFQKVRDAKKCVRKAKRAVSKVHKKIRNCRHDFAHKITNRLVQTYETICIEDINANSLIRKRWCNKQLLDAAWASFTSMLSYKAECAGRKLVKVNPAYTSQTCSVCGTRTVHELKDRTFKCSCGHEEDRDLNASRNILRLGLQSLGNLEAP